MMKKILLAALVLLSVRAFPQVPAPQVPVTGNIGAGGVFPVLNAGVLIMASDANRTMAYPEMSANVLKVTSGVPLTATRTLFAPLQLGFSFAIENATFGGQSICVGATTGACVTIPNGTIATVYCDGTDYVAAASGGGGSGTVGSGTTGQIAQYPSGGTSVQGATVSGDATLATGGAMTLANVNSVPGSCGDSTHVCQVTTNAKGLTTAQSAVAIAGSGPTPIAGALADYDFLQGTGTTVTDITGNGNDGTFGSTPPVWVSTGLVFDSFSESVNLPSALNSAETFMVALYINPATQTDATMAQYGTLINSTLGTSGVNLLYTGFSNSKGFFTPASFSYSNFLTTCSTAVSGFHVFTYVLGTPGTSLDHFYIDGQECTGADLQGASGGAQTGGNYILGSAFSSSFNGGGFIGTLYRTVVLPTQLTEAEVIQIGQQIGGDAASRGQLIIPAPQTQTTPTFFAIGDSITFGLGVTTPWESLMSLANQQAYTIQNYGIPSMQLSQMLSSDSNRVGPKCNSGNGPMVATIFGGTNDFNVPKTVDQVMSYLAGEVSILKQDGCRVFVATMLSRNGEDTQKDGYDAAILTNYQIIGADGVIDFAADPNLGADGAFSNATWFQGDGIHPTQTGQNRMGVIASNSLNYYFGAKPGNPTIVTAATYTMLSGDGYVTADPSSANQTLTLPDCTGPSGELYIVGNIQAAFTVTVDEGSASQPINGLTSVAVASNSSAYFKDVANPKDVSGCHWEQVSEGSGGGGSAITSLTGDVTATGPGAASSTVTAVHATSGTINGTTVGATTPAAGNFTTITTPSASVLSATTSGDIAVYNNATGHLADTGVPSSTLASTALSNSWSAGQNFQNLSIAQTITNGVGLQVATTTGCTITAGAIGGSCTKTLTLSVVEPDALYIVSGCTAMDVTAGPITISDVSSRSTTGFSVTMTALSITASNTSGAGTINCLVTHQ